MSMQSAERDVMRLSTKGRYAVMAMVDLAKHSEGEPIALAEIAERQEISLSYLEQLFAKLRIADVILAVDEPIRATRCAPGAPMGCRGSKSRCLTHDLWEELGNQIHLYLSSVTLADVVAQRVLGRAGALHSEQRNASLAAQ